MDTFLINKLIPLILAATPISLLLINIVTRHFSSYDPKLGNTTLICTGIDKILTQNKYTVRSLYFDKFRIKTKPNQEKIQLINLEKKHDIKRINKTQLHDNEIISFMAASLILCPFPKLEYLESSILNYLKQSHIPLEQIKNTFTVISKVPASPDKNYSTVVILNKQTEEVFALSKGNAIDLLRNCTKTFNEDRKIDIDKNDKAKIRKEIKKISENGEKVIGFCYKPLPKKRYQTYTEDMTEKDCTFLGFTGITAPLKTDLLKKVTEIKKTNIDILILTKHKERKAAAIGQKMGIVNKKYFETITGEYLRSLTKTKLNRIIQKREKDKDYVFAELTEQDKELILGTLRKSGETIAIPNPNLENSFQDIIDGIKHSRQRASNYNKVLKHTISLKIAEFILVLLTIILGSPNPLTAPVILFLDILINLPLQLALRAEPINKDVINKEYKVISTNVLNEKNIFRTILSGMIAFTIVFFLYTVTVLKLGWNFGDTISSRTTIVHKTSTFIVAMFILIQIISAYNLKKPKKLLHQTNIFNNPTLLLTTVSSLLIFYIVTSISLPLPLTTITSTEILLLLILLIIYESLIQGKKYIIKNDKWK